MDGDAEGQGQESVASTAPPPGARPAQSGGSDEPAEGGLEDAFAQAAGEDTSGGQEPEGGESPEEAGAAEEPGTLDDVLGEPPSGEETEEPEAGGEEKGEEPSEEDTAPEDAVKMSDIDAEFLPEGYYKDDSGAIHREDGSFASREELTDAIQQTVEEAEEFFSGEEEGESEEGEPDVEPVELELPGEEGSLEIQAEDEETREAVQQLQKDAKEGRQLRGRVEELDQREEKLEADAEELDAIERRLQEDPSGFMLNQLADDRREEVARDLLLLNDEVREKAQEWLNEWGRNPSQLEALKERRRRERLETEYETGQRTPSAQREKEAKRVANETVRRLRSLVPDEVSERRAEMFVQDAVADIQQHLAEKAREKGKRVPDPTDLDVENVPQLVSDRLELYGFDVPSGNGDNPTDVPEATPADEETEEFARKAEEYRRTGERLRKARARKREAAQSAPAGAGSTPSTPGLPDDADLDDALDYAEQAVG